MTPATSEQNGNLTDSDARQKLMRFLVGILETGAAEPAVQVHAGAVLDQVLRQKSVAPE
jgi:hypothetical protein